MKRNTLLVLIMLFGLTAAAQEIKEIKEESGNAQRVEVQAPFADLIEIQQGSGNEIRAWAEYEINNGKDNDKFVLKFEREGNTLVCTATFKDYEGIEMDLDGENDEKVVVKSHKHKFRDNHINMDLHLRIWVPENIDVEAGTISGDITTTVANLPLDLNSISGDLDITIDASARADLECHSISGKVYADPVFDFEIEADEASSYVPFANIEASLNGGGEPINLNTISGNIYIRKK